MLRGLRPNYHQPNKYISIALYIRLNTASRRASAGVSDSTYQDFTVMREFVSESDDISLSFSYFHIVQILLKAGADPNLIQGEHFTPLRAAISGKQLGVVNLLIKYSADANARSLVEAFYHSRPQSEHILNIALKAQDTSLMITLLVACSWCRY